jgi:hypothetical protein
MKYDKWTLIDWDGNPELGYKCWRKSFGGGHVSVGVGEFNSIVYSYGPNSENSMSGTRWRSGKPHLTEAQAMQIVDACKGYHDYKTEEEIEREIDLQAALEYDRERGYEA